MRTLSETRERLIDSLASLGQAAFAVSGGVDSMTLAWFAHRTLGEDCLVFHAVSPAVPTEATERVRSVAHREGWRLHVIDAGEIADPRYSENPPNRCFYCKMNLYAAIARYTDWTICSGANVDDLADYRPGLEAARLQAVRHPLIEANIEKAALRMLAESEGLEFADLPASPCLSSRIETGLVITIDRLGFVQEAERLVAALSDTDTVRCRVRRDHVEVALGKESLTAMPPHAVERLRAAVESLVTLRDIDLPVVIEPYVRGTTFLRDDA